MRLHTPENSNVAKTVSGRLSSFISIVCLNSALYLSERCKEFVVFVLSYAYKLSVKSISHVWVERGTNAGLIVTLYKHFHMLAQQNLQNFLLFPCHIITI